MLVGGVRGIKRSVVLSLLMVLWLGWANGGLGAIPDQGHWITGAPASTKRTEVAVAAVNGIIDVVGGFSAPSFSNLLDLTVRKSVEAYNPTKDTWTTKAPLPLGLHHAGAAELNGKLYVVGGFTAAGFSIWNPVNHVFIYDPGRDEWIERAGMPTARGGLAVVNLENKLYAIGGYNGESNPNAVEMYDPITDSWASVGPLPTPRDHLTAVSLGGRIYAIGGRVGLSYRDNLTTVEEYDPAHDQWKTKANMPTARSGITAGVIDGWIYVVGGGSAGGTFHANERYSPRLNTWQAMPPMPTARHGLGSAVLDQRFYVISGGPTPGGSYSDRNEIFISPAPSPSIKTSRVPRQHIGSVMALLAVFEKAQVLPPESSPEANQLIRALIQFQAAFLKSSIPAVRNFFSAAVEAQLGERAGAVSQAFHEIGWTSETLEALVDYSTSHSLWDQPDLRENFAAYNLKPGDWEIVQRTYLMARRQLAAKGQDLHAVFASHRQEMPGGQR